MAETTPAFVARRVDEVPLDPAHARWTGAAAHRVDLLPQTMATPQGGGATTALEVRALHDGARVGFHISWASASAERSVGIRGHRDACAIMFPAVPTASPPPFFMGAKGQPVVIWQWKPDWEDPAAQETARLSRYPEYADHYNPANDALFAAVGDRPAATRANVIVAEGFGSASRTEDAALEVRSAFAEGRWRVVFRRAIPVDHPPISLGMASHANFAVWEGAAGEVGARKSLSWAWQSYSLEGPSPSLTPEPTSASPGRRTPSPGVIAAGATAAAIAWAIGRRNRAARGGGGQP